MAVAFDPEALYVRLDATRRQRHIQWRDIAAEAEVSASTFTRMGLHGKQPDATNLVKILTWLGETDLKPYIREHE